MKRHTLSILLALTSPLLLLSGCTKEQLVAPDPDPATPTVTEDGKITLAKPIVLRVAVAPMRIVESGNPTPGDLQHGYDQAEIGKASVNTLDNTWYPQDLTVNDYDDAKRLRHLYSMYDGGDDWIRSVSIPELSLDEGEYKVEGVAPWETMGHVYKPLTSIPSAVTVTIYRLPESRTISVYANSEVLYNTDGKGDQKDYYGSMLSEQKTYYAGNLQPGEKVGDRAIILASNNYLDLNTHYGTLGAIRLPFLVERAQYMGDKYFRLMRPRKLTLMESRNLPMFGRVTDLEVRSGKVYGKQLGQETAEEVKTIYLERAVAKVEVSIDSPQQAFQNRIPKRFEWFDQIRPGTYMNFISFLPNNWDGLRTAIEKYGVKYDEKDGYIEDEEQDYFPGIESHKKFPYIRHGLQKAYGLNKDKTYLPIYADLERGGKQNSFFYPEDKPADASEQSTIRIAISDFTYDATAADGLRLKLAVPADQRHKKVFNILFGDKGENGLYEVRRNTLYRLHLSLVDGRLEWSPGVKVLRWKEADEQRYLIDSSMDDNSVIAPIEKQGSGTNNN